MRNFILSFVYSVNLTFIVLQALYCLQSGQANANILPHYTQLRVFVTVANIYATNRALLQDQICSHVIDKDYFIKISKFNFV